MKAGVQASKREHCPTRVGDACEGDFDGDGINNDWEGEVEMDPQEETLDMVRRLVIHHGLEVGASSDSNPVAEGENGHNFWADERTVADELPGPAIGISMVKLTTDGHTTPPGHPKDN